MLEVAAAEARFDDPAEQSVRLVASRPGPVRDDGSCSPQAAVGVAVAIAAGLLLLSPSG